MLDTTLVSSTLLHRDTYHSTRCKCLSNCVKYFVWNNEHIEMQVGDDKIRFTSQVNTRQYSCNDQSMSTFVQFFSIERVCQGYRRVFKGYTLELSFKVTFLSSVTEYPYYWYWINRSSWYLWTEITIKLIFVSLWNWLDSSLGIRPLNGQIVHNANENQQKSFRSKNKYTVTYDENLLPAFLNCYSVFKWIIQYIQYYGNNVSRDFKLYFCLFKKRADWQYLLVQVECFKSIALYPLQQRG